MRDKKRFRNEEDIIKLKADMKSQNSLKLKEILKSLGSVENMHLLFGSFAILSSKKENIINRLERTLGILACPYVVGVSALLVSAYPELGPSELKERLMSTSLGGELQELTASGYIDAKRALENMTY